MTDKLASELRKKIIARYQGSELANHLNHIQRFLVSLDWIPDEEGLLYEPGSGAGLFTELMREYKRFKLETTNFEFNLEKEPIPFPDECFQGVLLMEVLEHFAVDPMYAISQINRVLKPGGFLFLSTPNNASWRSLHNIINYDSPHIFGIFTRSGSTDRHNREYSVGEVSRLMIHAGFRVERLEALNVYAGSDVAQPIPGIPTHNRGDTTFCLGRKEGAIRDRYPAWLYWL